MPPFFDMKLLGGKEMNDALSTMSDQVQKKIVKGAMRRVVDNPIRQQIINNINSLGLVDEGNYRMAFANSNVKMSFSGKRGKQTAKLPYPTRDELGIREDDKYFYPACLEYGWARPGRGGSQVKDFKPRPHIRPAIDKNFSANARYIRGDINDGIQKEWKKQARKISRAARAAAKGKG